MEGAVLERRVVRVGLSEDVTSAQRPARSEGVRHASLEKRAATCGPQLAVGGHLCDVVLFFKVLWFRFYENESGDFIL